MKKQILVLLSAIVLSIGLAACGPEREEPSEQESESSSFEEPSSLPAEVPPPADPIPPAERTPPDAPAPSPEAPGALQSGDAPPYEGDPTLGTPENPIALEPRGDEIVHDPDAPLGSPENPIAEEPQLREE